MGTHPIFESDFDCLTEFNSMDKFLKRPADKGDEVSSKKAKTEEDREKDSEESKKKIESIVSWNVAGITAAVKKDFCDSILKINPDVVCIQETKTSSTKSPPPEIRQKLKEWKYQYYFDCSVKKGYAGVAMLCKKSLFRWKTEWASKDTTEKAEVSPQSSMNSTW